VRWSGLVVLLIMLMSSGAWGSDAPLFDLSGRNFSQQGGYALQGQWAFHWDELRAPGLDQQPVQRTYVPMSWVFYNPPLPSDGVASYRALVRLPNTEERIGLRLEWVYSAYRLYWNGKLVHEAGKVGRTPESYQAEMLGEILLLPVDPAIRDNELLIQVANFTHHKPGIVVAPYLDIYDSLLIQRERTLTLQIFIAGAIFLMGIYHLWVFIVRRDEYSTLFFALMCFTVSLYLWISGEGFHSFAEYIPNNVWWFMYFLCWILGVAMFLMFSMSIFPKQEYRPLSLVFLAMSYVAIVAIILLPVRYYFEYVLYVQLMHAFLGAYLVYLGMRAALARIDGSLFYLLATLIIGACLGNDILMAEQKIDSIYLTGRGVLIFVSLQSFILAQRHARAHQTVAQYSVELEVLKKDLEKQIEARTSALHIALKETRKMNERLINLSRTDALTGAFNRRYFVEKLDEEWRRAMREKKPLVMLIIDIDHFKQFNDKHGHLCGDHCLRHVAALIKQYFQRAGDCVARYGGEEFAVLVYGDSIDNVYTVAERLRVELNEKPFEFDGKKLYVTLSMGIGELVPTADFRQDSLIRIADSAMYKAKATGRNRVIRADLPGVREA